MHNPSLGFSSVRVMVVGSFSQRDFNSWPLGLHRVQWWPWQGCLGTVVSLTTAVSTAGLWDPTLWKGTGTIANWGIQQCVASSGALLYVQVYVCSIRCTTFELMCFWVDKVKLLHLKVLWLSLVVGIIHVYLLRLTVPSLYNTAAVRAVGHSWDCNTDLCVCAGIHLDVIKPGGRMWIIKYSLIITY